MEFPGGNPIPLPLDIASFRGIIAEYKRGVSPEAVFLRIFRLLFEETAEQRRRHEYMHSFYRGYHKIRLGNAVRIFFKADEENHILYFSAYHKSDLN